MNQQQVFATFQLENKSTAKYLGKVFGSILFGLIILPTVMLDFKIFEIPIFFVAFVIYLLFVRYFPLLNVVGTIEFNVSGLKWQAEQNVELKWEEISVFKIDYWGYRQGWVTQTSMGNENIVIVKDQYGNEFKNFLHLRNKSEFEILQKWLEFAYQNGIQIEESIGEGSSYCLKRLNYAEVQAFKAKYSNA